MNTGFCLELAQVLRTSKTYGQGDFMCAEVRKVDGAECCTPGCIAGHAVALGHRHEHHGRMVVPVWIALPRREQAIPWYGTRIATEARDLMGITDEQALALFEGDPYRPWKEVVWKHQDPEQVLGPKKLEEYRTYPTREDAADVVEAMVASGGTVDWGPMWHRAIGGTNEEAQ